MNQSAQTALFALGNFWDPEYEFSKVPGVLHVEAGYTGGTSAHPTYHDIGDHAEAVQIEFDPRKVSYEQLLEKFWHWHDPTAKYETRFRSCIFYLDETQRQLAEASKDATQERFNEPITTDILPANKFYIAESHNQNYLAKLRGEM